MDERLSRQLAFALEIDKEKNIFRQTHLSGHGRNENDAEHAWHMALMSWLLREYANEEVDITRVMLMCLIHDIVEIDAGDTYAYDEEGLATQKEREEAAKEKIFSILPEDQRQELVSLFDEFEAYESAESKFAHSMDNLQPLLLNDSNGGADWREHGVYAKQVYGRQGKTRMGSETLYHVTDQIIKKNIEKGNIKTDIPKESRPECGLPYICSDDSGMTASETTPERAASETNTPEGAASETNTAEGRVSETGTPEGTVPEQTAPDRKAFDQTVRMGELYNTVARLRAPDGCPWDRAQTHESLKAACIEEAAEVISGINILGKTGKSQSLCEELGDLLLQVVMHAQIAEEEGLFSLDDVIRTINEKMIRRHPHVFRHEASSDWKAIKAMEKKGREWEEPYLFDAFKEAEELIDAARKRKNDL